MDSTATVHTVHLRRALGFGLLGAGVVTLITLFGGASDARADGLLPVVDDLLGTVGTVVDTVDAPLATVSTVVETVVTEVVSPVAVVADAVVAEVPVVSTVVESTLGETPVADVAEGVSHVVTGTVDGVTTVVDGVTDAVLPPTPSLPGGPGIPVIPGTPGAPDVAGPVIPGLTVTSTEASAAIDIATRTTLIVEAISTPAKPTSLAPAPAPVGTAGSSVPQVVLAPAGAGSTGGAAAHGAGSAGGAAVADGTTPPTSFALPVTGRESARDDDLPPSPSSEFDTSPD